MKKILFISAYLILLFATSCHKSDKPVQSPNVPVIYYLSDSDKALFNFYQKGKSIKFTDQNAQELFLYADTITNVKFSPKDRYFSGEQLILGYSPTTNYLINFFITYQLLALSDSECALHILFGNHNNSNTSAVISSFKLNPHDPNQTGFSMYNADTLRYEKLDSVVLQNRKFYNIYFLKNSAQQNRSDTLTYFAYYSKTKGIIAFKNEDNRFWVMKE